MDRIIFGIKDLNRQRLRMDRFIAPRASFPEMRRRITWDACCQLHDYEIWENKYLKQKKYMQYLNDAFGLKSLRTQESIYAELNKSWGQSWPCVPRKRRSLSSAGSILDLPTYSYAPFPEIIDWGSDNILVAALGTNYHKWSWRTQYLLGNGSTQNNIQCCKFNPSGELLLLGAGPKVEIHNNALNKFLVSTNCRCVSTKQPLCSVTAIDWSPTGNAFVLGCSNGMLCSVSQWMPSTIMNSRQYIQKAILVVRVSPDARYVAAAAVDGDVVLVLSWPNLEIYSRLQSEWTIKTLAWHPWRTALLGIGFIGSNLHTHIAVWDAPTRKICESNLGHKAYSVDAMLFSHKTGELVLSLWDLDTTLTNRKYSQLLVMSDLYTVVDQWGEGRIGLDRVRTMVFSPDGTMLATATADEDLIIWNFIPEDKDDNIRNWRRFSAMPQYLDLCSYGSTLR